jgi:NTE family protein
VSKDFDLRAGFRYDNYWERIYPFTYSSRQSYTTLYALWQNDLFNTAYTPTKGYAYSIEVSYLMEERTKRGSNFWVLRGEASVAIPLGSATTLTPSFYVRSLFGEAIPMFYSNVIGGYLPGRFLSQQIPFVGFTRCEFVGPYLVQSNIALQQRLIADVYITMLANYAYIREKLSSDSQGQNALGVSLQLSYDTTIGPLMLSCHWNSLYHRFGAYFCFGFEF